MPTFRKVAAEPAPEPARAEVGQIYDALLAGFAAGEWGRVELAAGERRVVVRARLQAAAKRRGLALRFRPGPGPMLFCVEQTTFSTSPTTASPPSKSPPLPPAPEPPVAPPGRAQRRPLGDRKAGGRYDDVLPRWMREGEKRGRR